MADSITYKEELDEEDKQDGFNKYAEEESFGRDEQIDDPQVVKNPLE